MFSQAWGPAIDLRDPRFLAFATAEHQLLQSEYDDYAIASSSSLACFRYVAIIVRTTNAILKYYFATYSPQKIVFLFRCVLYYYDI